MRIQMHFPNLHSTDQEVSASSQQLHELRFLAGLARKQQFILQGTLGLKTKPSKREKGILSKSKPRGTTLHIPPGTEAANRCRVIQGMWFSSQDTLSCGKAAHCPRQRCYLHAADLLHCHPSPEKSPQPLLEY